MVMDLKSAKSISSFRVSSLIVANDLLHISNAHLEEPMDSFEFG